MKWSSYIKLILVDVLGVALTVTSRTTWLDEWLKSWVTNIDSTKLILFAIGVSVTVVYFNITIIHLQSKLDAIKDTRNKDHRLLKSSYLSLLADELNTDFSDCNVRIFLPKNSNGTTIRNFFRKEKNQHIDLEYVPFNGLHRDEINQTLKFKVSPEHVAQGMVGETYSTNKICVQLSLAQRESNEFTGRMNDVQNALSHDFEFIITFPILNPKNKKIGIASIDSTIPKNFVVASQDQFKNTLLRLGLDINDSFVNLV